MYPEQDGKGSGAGGGTRTPTVSPLADFESAASTVPPPRLAVFMMPQRALSVQNAFGPLWLDRDNVIP